MSQQLNAPNDENELRNLQDQLFRTTQEQINNGQVPKFKGLLEIASSNVTIVSAIHKIKANKGSKTAGTDGKVMDDFLQMGYDEVIRLIQNLMKNYNPIEIRRVFIPKPGKKEKRPLGIPAIADRIIQECVRMTIEPILEAQFFKHSYGFRPMRDTKQAVERVVYICNRIGYNWVVEGDIKGFFDNVNHTILLKQLWHLGIRDRRMLMIINEMLKAGIMDEIKRNEIGTPQGGIISPILANVYLHALDSWITREWEEKEMRNGTTIRTAKYASLRNHSTITRPEFYVRYADDWVLFTNTKENAEIWKHRIKSYLSSNLKLELSEDKTFLTNIKKKPINFLGFTIKMLPRKKSYIGYTYPNEDKIKSKVQSLTLELRKLKFCSNKEWLINDIQVINSKIRGLINYYNASPGVNLITRKFTGNLKYTCYKCLKKHGAKWVPANQCYNLKFMYPERTEQVPAVQIDGNWIGILNLGFATWEKVPMKNQEETPYTSEGREMYLKRASKRPLLSRVEGLLSNEQMARILSGAKPEIYNFEFFMNRCYAFNRDKGQCKVCKFTLAYWEVNTHHIDNKLGKSSINKVPNLVTICVNCHKLIHKKELCEEDTQHIPKSGINKLYKYRGILKEGSV